MPGKRVQFDDDTWQAIDAVAALAYDQANAGMVQAIGNSNYKRGRNYSKNWNKRYGSRSYAYRSRPYGYRQYGYYQPHYRPYGYYQPYSYYRPYGYDPYYRRSGVSLWFSF
ncbi:MAG: hypothetical protein JJE37_02315 [Methyloceanibacter sp.]|nr:hypothetical protein [Methyloceanibacter sp.]